MLISHGRADMKMPEPRPAFAYLATALRDKHPKLAYLRVVESRVIDADEENEFLRDIWNGGEGKERVFISAGGYTRDTALRTAEDKGGLVAFGCQHISNASAFVFAIVFYWSVDLICSLISLFDSRKTCP